jgi:hypothetical protein
MNDIHSDIKKRIDHDYFATDQQRDWTNEDMRFCDVDGAMYEGWLEDQFADRPKFEFNKVAQAVYRFVGEWATNRAEVKYLPDDDAASEDDAKLLTGLYRKDFRRSNGMDSVDNAVMEMAKGGCSAFRLKTQFIDPEDPENENQRVTWEPIYNAHTSVVWDANAKEYDKSDAKYVIYLEEMTREAAEEEWGDKVSSAFDPPNGYRFNWNNPTHVWIAHYYEIRKDKVEAITFQGPLGRKRTVYADDFKQHMDELVDGGFEEIKRRKIVRHTVWKTIIDGTSVLEEPVRIPGKFLPIIPMYGYRSYVDGQEFWYGIVRKQKDANRLFNMSASSVAESAATSSKDMPILTDQQVEGRENDLAQMHLGQYNYVVINDVQDENGNSVPAGPVGTWAAPRVDPNNAAVMQMSADFIREETGGNPQDVMDPQASGKAIGAVQQRVDMQTHILMDNISKSLKRCGEVYRAVAGEVYDSERMVRTVGEDGTESSTILFDFVIDRETGEPKFINDITRGSFETIVDTGPAYASRKRETVDQLERIAAFALPDYQPFIFASIVENIDGVGLDPLKEFNKKQMLIQGLREPESKEEIALVEEMSQQTNAQDELIQAATQQQLAEAEEKRANAQKNSTQAQLNTAKAVEVMNGIKVGRFQAANETLEIAAARPAKNIRDDLSLERASQIADIKSKEAKTRKDSVEADAQELENQAVRLGLMDLANG